MVATIGIDLITDQFQCHAAHMTNWITWAPSHGLRLTIGRQRWLDESLVSLRDQGLIHAYGAYPWKDRLLWRLHGPGAPRDLVSIVLAEYYVQALCDDVGLPWRPVPPSGGQDSYHQVRAWTSPDRQGPSGIPGCLGCPTDPPHHAAARAVCAPHRKRLDRRD
jgi:hypothetical protein